MEEVQNRVFHIYKHTLPSAQYIFGSEAIQGRTASFVNHIYFTDDEDEIKELNATCATLIKQNKQTGITVFIYIDPEQVTGTLADVDPIEKLRQQIRTEERSKLLAEFQKEANKVKDAGTYESEQQVLAKKPLVAFPTTKV